MPLKKLNKIVKSVKKLNIKLPISICVNLKC